MVVGELALQVVVAVVAVVVRKWRKFDVDTCICRFSGSGGGDGGRGERAYGVPKAFLLFLNNKRNSLADFQNLRSVILCRRDYVHRV